MPSVTMPFDGFTQEMYAQKMIDELKAADVRPRDVFPQSFDIDDVLYWIQHEPAYGRQAVFLDDANVVADLPTFSDLMGYRERESESGRRPRLPCSRSTGQPHRPLAGRARRERRRARHHHLDTGTLGHPGRRQQRLLLPDDRPGDQTRWRSLQSARRPCERRGHPWRVFRLGRARHLLRQLHGLEVELSDRSRARRLNLR